MSISQHVNVTICSPFRDSAAGIAEYIERASSLKRDNIALRFICVEGDSTDGTLQQLQAWACQCPHVTLVKCDTGKPKHGSYVDAERFQVLAQVFNAALDAVDLEWSDYVLFLPSDIHYQPDLLSRLLAHNVDMVAPMVWQDNLYYDTWASRKDGRNWINFTRQWAAANLGNELIEMETIGGTVLIGANVLKSGCRYTPDEVDQGLSKMAREKGVRLWIDPTAHVGHNQPVPEEKHIPNGGNLASIENLEYETVKAAIFNKYGFTPPDAYIYDFIDFVTALTR
jgi:glycosyltransferase involved in cell wall biosynthesis